MTYSGATRRLTLSGLTLRGHGFQVKQDGCFVSVRTDSTSAIVSLSTRNGRSVSPADSAGLLGLVTGLPDAELHGELEAHTEAGLRARAARGWSAVHLFDIASVASVSIASLPYRERYTHLLRWQSAVECGGVPRFDWWSIDRRGDAHGPRGRYVRPVPKDLRRLPVVRMVYGKAAAEDMWRTEVEIGGGEGLVACKLDAPMGARAAKSKIKLSNEIDCLVLSIDTTCALLSWRGHVFACPASGWIKRGLKAGDTVEATCDGFYSEGVQPRFARITRVRHDKVAA